jgi:hypothetical protein
MWIADKLKRLFLLKKRPQESSKNGGPTPEPVEIVVSPTELHSLDIQLRSGSQAVRIAAAERLAAVGERGTLVLMSALEEDDPETYETAAWGIEVPLIGQSRGGLDKERLRRMLKPAIGYLIGIVKQAVILKGAAAYDRKVSSAIGVLGAVGDPDALPALQELLSRVRRKIEAEGIVKERVETRETFRSISTEDSLHHLERQIEMIKGRDAIQA